MKKNGLLYFNLSSSYLKRCFIAALLASVVISCSENIVETENGELSGDGVVFVVNDDAETYTYLGGGNKILWQEGDKIGIFCQDVHPAAINAIASIHPAYVGQNKGVFKSNIAWGTTRHKYYVYYPWRSDQSTEPSNLRHVIEPEQFQEGINNSNHIGQNAFMCARANSNGTGSDEISVDFTHTTCVLELSFKSPSALTFGKEISKVVFKADNGATLSGNYDINITVANPVPTFTAPSDSVVLGLQHFLLPNSLSDSVQAYIVINPTTLTDVTVNYYIDGVECTFHKEINKTLAAQKIYKLTVPVDYERISVSPSTIYLSPNNPSQTVTVESMAPWSLGGTCNVATLSPATGLAGTTNVTLTRKTSLTDYSVYGNTTVTFITDGPYPKSATINVANLHLDVPETIYVPNPVGADTTVYLADIIAFGGDAKYVVESYTGSWIQSITYDSVTHKLKIVADNNSSNIDRPGTVTVHHFNDPDYKVTVPLLQNQFIYIPEFKYFVIDIQWCKRVGMDLDIAFMFENNVPVTPFEHLPVGWGANLYKDSHLVNQPSNPDNYYVGSHGSNATGLGVLYNSAFYGGSINLLNWGGDAVDGEGETVYFDAESFHDATDVPRYLRLGLYLNWYAHVSSETWYARAILRCYQGGTMVKYSSMTGGRTVNYRNEGGTLVHQHSFFIQLNPVVNSSDVNFMTRYTYAAKIVYDRLTHYGMMSETDETTPKWSADRPLCSNGSDTYETRSASFGDKEFELVRQAKDKAAISVNKK